MKKLLLVSALCLIATSAAHADDYLLDCGGTVIHYPTKEDAENMTENEAILCQATIRAKDRAASLQHLVDFCDDSKVDIVEKINAYAEENTALKVTVGKLQKRVKKLRAQCAN